MAAAALDRVPVVSRMTEARAAPPSHDDSLRIVKIRLTLALVATAVLPAGLALAALRLVSNGAAGIGAGHLVSLALVAVLLVTLIVWMAHRIVEPAARLEDSRRRLRVAYDEAREMALVDGLTGLGNHRAFQEEFEAMMAQAQRYGHPMSLVLVDLDEFKQVNDTQGHAVGDDVLAEVGRLVQKVMRRSDRAFRIGGDEFAVLLSHTDVDGGAQFARRLLNAGLERRHGGRYPGPISFSAGVGGFPAHAASREELQIRTDAALYRGKRSGRTAVTVVHPELDGVPVTEQNRANLSAEIASVLANGELRPVYQPLIHLDSGRVIGFEGLIRPKPGSVFTNPGALFTAAEVSGRTVELDLACLATVIRGAIAIRDPLLVTLNVSPRTLEAPEFSAARLLSMLAREGFPPDRVILELTEREPIQDTTRVVGTLEACRKAGIRIAADDVGAGNAGLRLLAQYRFDVVKADLSLVQAGVGQEAVRGVLASLVDLAARWGALVVAEGVETRHQLAMARELGIGAAQGYLLARPGDSVDLEQVDIEALLARPTDPLAILGLDKPVPPAVAGPVHAGGR